MEIPKGISISELFTPQAAEDPEIIDLMEWYISGDCGGKGGGKDGKGVAVRYDLGRDILVPDSDFRERVAAWKSVESKSDHSHLKVIPDEATFRAYLTDKGVFHEDLGIILRSDDYSYLDQEQETGF